MALVVKDRVKENTTTTGTANLTLGGAVYGFQSFSVIGNGNTTYYAIYDSATGDWEVGLGTYSTTGPTLSRDTVLESSNAGSKVSFGAGSKDVFCTYPAERSVYLDGAGSAVTLLDVGTLGAGTANITSANITAGTVATTPTTNNDLVNKQYVDTLVSSGITYHTPVKYEVPDTTGNLNATYNNGAAGVGATLTNAGTLTAFTPDGVTASVGDRVLVYNQTSAAQNGVYTVTTVGSGSVAWVLTRATDADTYALKNPNGLGEGDAFFITSGNTGAGETYVCNTVGTITFGTTAITFAQVSTAQVYSAGTGLTLTGTQFSITPTGTAGTYGSASQVPVLTTNASGQVTSVTNTAIAISAGAVSGLAPSATTDTTNASNITSGTLPSARLAGSYTGITGVGTLTAGTWNADTIAAAYGGTGQSSYTVGDLLYASGTSALSKLADVAYGNVLLSGGAGTAPSYGKVNLTDHITGTLAVVNGGTGATTASGARSNLGLVIGTDIPSPSGTGASGTWNINVTGSAGSAGTATTAAYATYAGYVANTVTFNNSGAGAASGNGFNGSGALTVSYNTIGAPSTTGSGASGTWGIDISGNAATATSAGASTTAVTLTSTQSVWNTGVINNVVGMLGWRNYGNSHVIFDASASLSPSATSISNTNSTYAWGPAYPTLMGWNGVATYGVRVDSARQADILYSSTAAYASIYYDYANTSYYVDPASTSVIAGLNMATGATNNLFIGRNSTATAYNAISLNGNSADSANMGLTGGGGTDQTLYINSPGSISVRTNSFGSTFSFSGSEFSAPGAITSGGNNGFRNDVYYGATRNPIWCFGNATSYGLSYFQGSSGLGGIDTIGIHPNGTPTGSGSVLMVTSSYTQSLGSMRAPIFYDSDNTGYYVDPASTSNIGATYINSHLYTSYNSSNPTIRVAGSGDAGLLLLDGGSNFKVQIYGTGTNYGFLNGAWAGWDIQKTISGNLYLNGNGSYYLNPASDNNFYRVYGQADIRSPIYYDLDNTSYYVDPANVSNLATINTQNAVSNITGGLRNVMPGGGAYATGASVVSGAIVVRLPTNLYPMIRFTVKVYTYDGLSFDINCGGHTSSGYWYNTFAWMATQHRPAMNVRFTYDGTYVYVYIGDLGSSWSYPQVFITDVQVGYSATDYSYWDDGWSISFNTSTYNSISATHTVYPPTSSSNNTNPAYASIYYDANNTGYYVDPSNYSYMYSLGLSGASYFQPNNWIQFNDPYGLYWPNHYGAHLHANNLSSYTQLAIRGSKSGYSGIYDQYSGWAWMNDSSANGGFYREGSGLWSAYFNYGNGCWGLNTSTTFSGWDMYGPKGFTAGTRMDSPIYYDANNTGYYVDPSVNSRINGLYSDSVYCYGNVTAYYSSDRKFKENIRPISNALDIVLAVGGKLFDWTDEYLADNGGENAYLLPKQSFGIVAQDLLPHLPQAIRTRQDGSLAVDYEKLSAVAFEAVKILEARVAQLEAR